MVERDCHELLAPGFRVDFVTRLSYLAAWPSLEPRLLQVLILFFFAGPTDSPSQETGWWKTKHFMGKALRLGSLTVDSCSFSFSAESLTQEWLVSFFKGALRVREKETWAERWLSIDYWSKAGTSPFPSDCCRASPFQLAHNSAMVASSTRCTKFNYFNYFLLMFMSWNSLTESSCWVGYLTVGDARK